MKQLDVVTFGETMVLFQGESIMPLEYVGQFHKQVAGAESNTAIGLQRLGHTVGWFSKLGNDPFGRSVLQFVRGEGVDTSHCSFTDEAPTGIFFKEKKSAEQVNVFYYRKNGAASLLGPDDVDEAYIANAKVLHITGITPALSESCQAAVFKALEIAKQNNVTVVFDPNLRLKLWDKAEAKTVFHEIATAADVILPGLDEGTFMTGKETPEAVAAALIGNNPNKTVVIKLGAEGAFYQSRGESGYIAGFPAARVVDPVGAGDGFAAGIISGLIKGEPLETVVRRANAIGAIVVGVNGDVEGLPRPDEVEAFVKQNKDKQDVIR